MNDNGYAVIVSDNRGHGASVNTYYTLGYMDSYQKIVDDHFLISKYIGRRYPDKPIYLLGHSLGSVFARLYLEKHDAAIQKLVLSGTVYYNSFTPLGILLAHAIISLRCKRHYNYLLPQLVMNVDDIVCVSTSQTTLANSRSDQFSCYK